MSSFVMAAFSRQDFQAAVNRRPAHLLGPFGRGVDVAMVAGLVAEARDVDLQRFDAERRQIEPILRQLFFEPR